MSAPIWRIMHGAADRDDLTKDETLVLLLLALDADQDGRRSHPGVARLARRAKLSERTAKRILSSLRDKGAVTQVSRGGGGVGGRHLAGVYDLPVTRATQMARVSDDEHSGQIDEHSGQIDEHSGQSYGPPPRLHDSSKQLVYSPRPPLRGGDARGGEIPADRVWIETYPPHKCPCHDTSGWTEDANGNPVAKCDHKFRVVVHDDAQEGER